MITFVIIIVVLLIGILGFKAYKNYYESNRYEQIKNDIYNETQRYLKKVLPNCHDGVGTRVDQDSLVINSGMDKSKLLDVDKKSYCKTTVNADCKNGEWEIDVYISCKDYQDDGYVEW